MLSKLELEACKNADICSFNKGDLPDMKSISINTKQPVAKRVEEYFDAVKNPYIFRVGDVGVKINCVGNKNLEESIIEIGKIH